MGEGSLLPDRGPPVRAEIVHESERTRVTRLFLSGAHASSARSRWDRTPSVGCSMRSRSCSGYAVWAGSLNCSMSRGIRRRSC